jgi:hypothetical protein
MPTTRTQGITVDTAGPIASSTKNIAAYGFSFDSGSSAKRTPSVRLAVVVGQPSEPGPYVIRVKVVPSGVKLMPHRHPEDRI